MLSHDYNIPLSNGFFNFDKRLLLQRQYLGSQHPGGSRPGRYTDGNYDAEDTGSEVADKQSRQSQSRHRHGKIGKARNKFICHAAVPCGQQRQQSSHASDDHCRKYTDNHGYPGSVNQLAENILAHIIGTKQMLRAGLSVGQRAGRRRIIGYNCRRDDGNNHKEADDQAAHQHRNIDFFSFLHCVTYFTVTLGSMTPTRISLSKLVMTTQNAEIKKQNCAVGKSRLDTAL